MANRYAPSTPEDGLPLTPAQPLAAPRALNHPSHRAPVMPTSLAEAKAQLRAENQSMRDILVAGGATPSSSKRARTEPVVPGRVVSIAGEEPLELPETPNPRTSAPSPPLAEPPPPAPASPPETPGALAPIEPSTPLPSSAMVLVEPPPPLPPVGEPETQVKVAEMTFKESGRTCGVCFVPDGSRLNTQKLQGLVDQWKLAMPNTIISSDGGTVYTGAASTILSPSQSAGSPRVPLLHRKATSTPHESPAFFPRSIRRRLRARSSARCRRSSSFGRTPCCKQTARPWPRRTARALLST